MAKAIVLYNTPVSPAIFDAYYAKTHTPLAKKIPGLRSFEVSVSPVATPQGLAPYHLIAILTFDSMAKLQAGMSSPEGQAAIADMANFATGGATVLLYEHREV